MIMKYIKLILMGIGLVLLLRLPVSGQLIEAADRAATRLFNSQTVVGSWFGEEGFTGSIVPGLISAYNLTGNPSYLAAAEDGGAFILSSAVGNYYGDEAYALSLLSEISSDPLNNSWRDALTLFYQCVRMNPGGTAAYIDAYSGFEPSASVFYLAHHAVAAYYVDATDKALWRNAVIEYLSEVADEIADYPVLSLGVATWALAKTGPLDHYIWILPSHPSGQTYFDDVRLDDLPGLILSHQFPYVDPFACSFYWRFDHGQSGSDPAKGYTEDTVFSVLGLIAAANWQCTGAYTMAIQDVRDIMPLAVETGSNSGEVNNHIWLWNTTHTHHYAGELLQALDAVTPEGDSDGDGDVDMIDFYTFTTHWLDTGCTFPGWCGGADLDFSGSVNLVDFAKLSHFYLRCPWT